MPVVAADGSSHSADELVVEAIAAMVGDDPTSQVAVAVPAHWTGATLRALRTAMRSKPNLVPNGVGAPAGLRCRGRPDRAARQSGTARAGRRSRCSTSAAGAPASRSPTRRATSSRSTRSATRTSPATSSIRLCSPGCSRASPTQAKSTRRAPQAVGSLSQLRDDCRRAKEALSEHAATEVGVELPGYSSKVQRHPARVRGAGRRRTGGRAVRTGRHVAAQQDSVGGRHHGGDGRRRGPHPADRPATWPSTRKTPLVTTVRCPRSTPPSALRSSPRTRSTPRRPTGAAPADTDPDRRVRRRGPRLGDVPGARVVAGRGLR